MHIDRVDLPVAAVTLAFLAGHGEPDDPLVVLGDEDPTVALGQNLAMALRAGLLVDGVEDRVGQQTPVADLPGPDMHAYDLVGVGRYRRPYGNHGSRCTAVLSYRAASVALM